MAQEEMSAQLAAYRQQRLMNFIDGFSKFQLMTQIEYINMTAAGVEIPDDCLKHCFEIALKIAAMVEPPAREQGGGVN